MTAKPGQARPSQWSERLIQPPGKWARKSSCMKTQYSSTQHSKTKCNQTKDNQETHKQVNSKSCEERQGWKENRAEIITKPPANPSEWVVSFSHWPRGALVTCFPNKNIDFVLPGWLYRRLSTLRTWLSNFIPLTTKGNHAALGLLAWTGKLYSWLSRQDMTGCNWPCPVQMSCYFWRWIGWLSFLQRVCHVRCWFVDNHKLYRGPCVV